MPLLRTAILALLTILSGCASTTGTAVATSNMLPTPYTADAIRAANPNGTRQVFRIEQHGKPATLSETRFVGGDEDGTTTESITRDPSGRQVGDVQSSSARWSELRDHALFPAANATRERARFATPIGSFEGWLYRVTEAGNTRSRFYFADGRAGPPVRYEMERDGTVIFTMIMIEDSRD